MRIDGYLESLQDGNAELGNIIFVLTEFQVMDAETARNNETGENSHAAYKERQRERVKTRLTSGSLAQRGRDLAVALEQQAASPASDGDDDDDG